MRAPLLVSLIALAAVATPLAALAEVYKSDGCQVTVPDGWLASRTRIATPDKKLWASLMRAQNAAEALQVEQSLNAAKVSEDAHMVLLVSSASFAGMTNKQYHAITKSSPSCVADVTSPAGPQEATARQIAATVGLAR